MKIQNKFLVYIFIIFIVPALTQAHIIGGTGFGDGIFHPISGFDHLLAMVAVGIISTLLGKKATWMMPLTFVAMMILGGIASILGLHLAGVEIIIALSLVLLGIGIAFVRSFNRKFSLPISLICVSLAAFFHGHAHGAEMQVVASPIDYFFGFVLSTSALHVGGVSIGHYGTKTWFRVKLLRLAGIAVSLAGFYLLLVSM